MTISVSDLTLSVASVADAAGLVEVIHAAFGARPPLHPPATAATETPASVAATLAAGAGIYAQVHGHPAGALLITAERPTGSEDPTADGVRVARFSRVSVHPEYQRHGIASVMVPAALDLAAELGFTHVDLFAREEFAELIAFWEHRGFRVRRPAEHGVVLGRELPIAVTVPTARAMRTLGARLAEELRAGDLIIAAGELGAGKTTLTQGIGAGLDSEGPVISPTFVLSRVHRSRAGRPSLVHVDAYRLHSAEELDDLAVEESVPESVTVVEWGTGLAEGLADTRLEIDIRRSSAAGALGDDSAGDHRRVLVRGVGDRWGPAELAAVRKRIGA